MKKLFRFLSVATLTTLTISCASDESQELNQVNKNLRLVQSSSNQIDSFLISATFERHKDFISTYGKLDIQSGIVKSLREEGADGEAIFIPITNEIEIVGVLEIVDLKQKGFLPKEDTYAINLVDYNDFDLASNSGVVRLIDLNYGNSLHSKITISRNIISDWEDVPVYYDSGENLTPSNGLYELCDSNSNSNISFNECYSCAKSAISDSGTFAEWFCDAPLAGWVGCWATISATCVVISSSY